MTLPDGAVQPSEIELLVVPVTRSAVGAAGTVGLGGFEVGGLEVGGVVGPPPPHEAPLSVQLAGVAAPDPLNPKETEAPGATPPFHDLLRNVNRCPDRVMSASQKVLMLAPAGRSKATVHDVIAVVPPLSTV